MTVVQFSMDGLPRGQGRPRGAVRGGHPVFYKASKDREYEASVKALARAAMGNKPPFTGPVSASFRFRLPIPKSETKRVREAMAAGEIAHISKPDISNMLKAIEDAMNLVVYVDDAQITRNFQTKLYHPRPGVDVRVEAFDMQAEAVAA